MFRLAVLLPRLVVVITTRQLLCRLLDDALRDHRTDRIADRFVIAFDRVAELALLGLSLHFERSIFDSVSFRLISGDFLPHSINRASVHGQLSGL